MQQDTPLTITDIGNDELYKNAKIYTTVYTVLGVIAFMLIEFSNSADQILSVLLLIYALIGFILIIYGKGLIRLYANKGSGYVSVSGGLLLAAISLAIQCILNTDTLFPYKLLTPSAVAVVVIFIVLYFMTIKKAKDNAFVEGWFAGIFAILLGFGVVAGANCAFDFSKEQLYPATVISHYTTQIKATYYHLTIGTWGTSSSSVNITVSQSTYNATPIGSKVTVHLNQGALNSPWFYVTE